MTISKRRRTFFGLAVSLCACALAGPLAAGTPIKISCLGDSITEGTGVPGGYRTKLAASLSQSGVTFQFVGSLNNNPSPALTIAGQTAHDGYNGYQIDQLAATNAWKTTGADFVLLHIGTNDILSFIDPLADPHTEPDVNFANHAAGRLSALLTQIRTDLPNAHILLSKIIPVNFTAQMLARTQLYNSAIQSTVLPAFAASGKVHLVDQYANFVDGVGNVKAVLLPDTVHPISDGYDTMGTTFANAITAVPEPTSLALLAIPGLLLARRRSN